MEKQIVDLVSFPSEYHCCVDNINFNCEVLAPETPVLTVSTAKKATVNYLSFMEKLVDNSGDIVETVIHNPDGTVTEYDRKIDVEEDELTNTDYLYTLKNGAYLALGMNRISYSTFNVYVTDALLLGEEDEGYNGDIYLTNTDLPFSTQNEVMDELKNMLRLYTNVEDTVSNVYCLDADTMNENRAFSEEEEKGGTATPFTHDDDGYYICMRQELQGLPVFAREKFFSTEYAGNTPIIAYYTKDGWKNLMIDGSLLYTFESSDEVVTLQPFDVIVDTISEYYNTLITENTYEVYRATLYNYVTEDGTVTPVWIVKIYETYPDGNFRCEQLDVNAVTGEVFTVYD